MAKSLIVSFLIFVVLAGCYQEKRPDSRTLFQYNQPNKVTSLDPAFSRNQANIWAVAPMFNGLVELNDQLKIKPSIAKSWTISEDGKLYRFLIKDDVYFHDHRIFPNGKGRKVRAHDVAYSLGRIIDPKTGSPGSWIFEDKLIENDPFRVVGDSIFEIHLSKAFRPLLGILTMQYCSVVPEEAILKTNFRTDPIGTGPFKLKAWQENQVLIYQKNTNYFESTSEDTLPKVDIVRVTFTPERMTAFLEFQKQNLDLLSGLKSSYVDQLLNSQGELLPDQKENLDFSKLPYLNTEYLGINMENVSSGSPLGNKYFRQALNFAIDRKTMLAKLRNNVGRPADGGFIPYGLPAKNVELVKGYTYDPQKAMDLLAKAGYPNGEGLSEIPLHTNSDYADLCTFLANQWQKIGIPVKVEIMESATLRELMTRGEVDFFRASWIADYPDEESFFAVFNSAYGTPPNYTRFKNNEFDELYTAALAENNDDKRVELYQQMDRVLIEEAPVVFLYYDETAVFHHKRVNGLNTNPMNLLSLKRAQVK